VAAVEAKLATAPLVMDYMPAYPVLFMLRQALKPGKIAGTQATPLKDFLG
jgi:hypothetical protein